MCLMTAKALSWTTFALLVGCAYPFVANPDVSKGVSSDIRGGGIALMQKTEPTHPLPICGKCNIRKAEEYSLQYAIDKNALCPPETPYRLVGRINAKIICEGGGYWLCDDHSTKECRTLIERPPCPNDTCMRVLDE
jgi:hypothetical protein